jgi:hypothetical protein
MKPFFCFDKLSRIRLGKYLSGLLTVLLWIFFSVTAATDNSVETGLKNGIRAPSALLASVAVYLHDSTGVMNFYENKKDYHFDSLLRLSDIEAGTPVHVYTMDFNKLKTEPDSVPISAIAIPTDSWYVPIIAHGKYLYVILFRKLGPADAYHAVQLISPGETVDNWKNAKAMWPESAGYCPVFIECESSRLFHFPQIDNHNLMAIRRGYAQADSFALDFDEATGNNNPAYASPGMKNGAFKMGKLHTGSYLADSRIVFKHLKKRQMEIDSAEKMFSPNNR